MRDRSDKGFGQGGDVWNSFNTGQEVWNGFEPEIPKEANDFGFYKPVRPKRPHRVVLILLSVFIALGGIAVFLLLGPFRGKTVRDSENSNSEVQEAGGPSQTSKKKTFQGQAGQNGSADGAGKVSGNQNLDLTEEKEEEPDALPAKDYSYAHGYYYSFLTDQEAKAYDSLVEACENLSAKAQVSLEDEVQEIDVLDAFAYDHPEYYWIFHDSNWPFVTFSG